jgi:hypothetical protein
MPVNFTPALCNRPAGPSEYSAKEELQIAGKCINAGGAAIDDQLIQPPLTKVKNGLSWLDRNVFQKVTKPLAKLGSRIDDTVFEPAKNAVKSDVAAARASAVRFQEEKKQKGYQPIDLGVGG